MAMKPRAMKKKDKKDMARGGMASKKKGMARGGMASKKPKEVKAGASYKGK